MDTAGRGADASNPVRVSPLARAVAVLLAAGAALVACPALPAAGPAERALDRARALFAPASVNARAGEVTRPDPREATIVLRDLRAALPRLSARSRAEAERFLARPTNETAPYTPGYGTTPDRRRCSPGVCIHWVDVGTDAPPLADADRSGAPDWVETTLAVFDAVWAREIDELGYRPPLSDLDAIENGGDERLDVYLADVATDGFFGWCTSDDPSFFATRRVSAFCVIDDDYTNANLNAGSPLAALRATAAHEFFHAVQFGYDWLEDLWLMEGTATWIEDEVFDGANDNLRYLRSESPLARPDVPVDRGRGGYEYGAWIFWRYLSERFGTSLVKNVWDRAAQRTSGNPYSLAATRGALRGRDRSFTSVFAGFGAANRVPGVRYQEGALYPGATHVPASPLGTGSVVMRHLSNRTVAFRPTRREGRLRVTVSTSNRRGAAATLLVRHASGAVSTRRIRMRDGDGLAIVPFGADAIQRVELVLTNAGTRFTCWMGTALSCGGISRDEKLRFVYQAEVL
jgi:hypothetical protein